MYSLLAYMLSAWCYLASMTMVLWLVPHLIHRCGIMIRIGFYLWAMCLVFRGNEAWGVADDSVVAPDWFFVNLLGPAAATLVIVGELVRHGKRIRARRHFLVCEIDGRSMSGSVQYLAHSEGTRSQAEFR